MFRVVAFCKPAQLPVAGSLSVLLWQVAPAIPRRCRWLALRVLGLLMRSCRSCPTTQYVFTQRAQRWVRVSRQALPPWWEKSWMWIRSIWRSDKPVLMRITWIPSLVSRVRAPVRPSACTTSSRGRWEPIPARWFWMRRLGIWACLLSHSQLTTGLWSMAKCHIPIRISSPRRRSWILRVMRRSSRPLNSNTLVRTPAGSMQLPRPPVPHSLASMSMCPACITRSWFVRQWREPKRCLSMRPMQGACPGWLIFLRSVPESRSWRRASGRPSRRRRKSMCSGTQCRRGQLIPIRCGGITQRH